jgi:hypothetical protein
MEDWHVTTAFLSSASGIGVAAGFLLIFVACAARMSRARHPDGKLSFLLSLLPEGEPLLERSEPPGRRKRR